MSTIRVDNFGPSAGGTTYSARGIAKAWANFDTNVPLIRDSENISSITDNGAGDHSLSITNAMSSNNYAAQLTGNMNITSSGVYVFGFYDINSTTTAQNYKSASLLRVSGKFLNTGGTSTQEVDLICASFHGDLA